MQLYEVSLVLLLVTCFSMLRFFCSHPQGHEDIFVNKLLLMALFVRLADVNWLLPFYLYVFRLAEVGKLERPKLDGKYETGQLFLHRVFGYRGVTLFPWMAAVFDRDVQEIKENRYLREKRGDKCTEWVLFVRICVIEPNKAKHT